MAHTNEQSLSFLLHSTKLSLVIITTVKIPAVVRLRARTNRYSASKAPHSVSVDDHRKILNSKKPLKAQCNSQTLIHEKNNTDGF